MIDDSEMRRNPLGRAQDVTIVAHDIGPSGGMELQVRELIQGCLADERRVTVICRTCDVPEHPRLRVHTVGGPSRPFPLAYPWFEVAAARALRRHRRGVVHTAGAIVPAPVDVLTVHFCHRAYNRMSVGSRASRDTPAHRVNARLAAGVAEFGERWSLRPSHVRSVIAISTGVRREVEELYPALRDRLSTIHHGVDLDRFRSNPATRATTRATWDVDLDELVALFVGGDWGRKGLEHAIRAVAASSGWRLVVAGEGDRERFGAMAAALGARERVIFLGHLTDTAPAFAAADVFLLPTAYETFSLVTFEAAASGLPLLAPPVHGPDELIVDGVNGHFLDDDPDRTALLLRDLGDDKGRRSRMGIAAHQAALPYTWDAAVHAHLALYDRLASLDP